MADAQNEARELWRTLRTVAPEYVVTADEMQTIVENPVPFGDAVAYAESLLDSADGR